MIYCYSFHKENGKREELSNGWFKNTKTDLALFIKAVTL